MFVCVFLCFRTPQIELPLAPRGQPIAQQLLTWLTWCPCNQVPRRLIPPWKVCMWAITSGRMHSSWLSLLFFFLFPPLATFFTLDFHASLHSTLLSNHPGTGDSHQSFFKLRTFLKPFEHTSAWSWEAHAHPPGAHGDSFATQFWKSFTGQSCCVFGVFRLQVNVDGIGISKQPLFFSLQFI